VTITPLLFSEDRPRETEADAGGGDFYDLTALAEEVRREYFSILPALPVRWGRRVQRKRRTSIRLGSYHRPTTSITIHPSLNVPNVPRYFIQSIIHHEYLHHILGADHDSKFHGYEREYQYYRESKAWLRKHIHSLLGRRPPRPLRARDGAFLPVAVSERPKQLALF